MGAGPTLKVYDSNPIGRGAFSTVYKGLYRERLLDSDRPVAVKRLKFRKDGDYYREAGILSRLEHENIIEYFGQFENAKGTYDLVLELARGNILARALHRGDLGTTWKQSTIHQISSGVAHLHSQNAIHLDLKPKNILFKDRNLQRILICGFGMATRAPSSRRAGARKFRAPDSPFTMKSDVFSLTSIACCIIAERNSESKRQTASIVTHVLKNYDFGSNIDWRLILVRGVVSRPHITALPRPYAEQFRDTFERSEEPIFAFNLLISSVLIFLFYLPWGEFRRTLKKWESLLLFY